LFASAIVPPFCRVTEYKAQGNFCPQLLKAL
jgi:hypothetical protein